VSFKLYLISLAVTNSASRSGMYFSSLHLLLVCGGPEGPCAKNSVAILPTRLHYYGTHINHSHLQVQESTGQVCNYLLSVTRHSSFQASTCSITQPRTNSSSDLSTAR
jgi:hypothetical protein